MTSNVPASFQRKKQRILDSLSRPLDAYTDLSPKGSVDVQIREFVDEINKLSVLVSTSSCAGRVSVFLDGRKRNGKKHDRSSGLNGQDLTASQVKDGDLNRAEDEAGKWLFVSHDALEMQTGSNNWHEVFGLSQSTGGLDRNASNTRLVHFKFEPMVCS
jgi:tRNA wybutosine-synthesizing protein 3